MNTDSNKPKRRQLRFDYLTLRNLMAAEGGIQAVCQRAGVARWAYYKVESKDPTPLHASFRKIIDELKLTPEELAKLFFFEEEET